MSSSIDPTGTKPGRKSFGACSKCSFGGTGGNCEFCGAPQDFKERITENN